MFLRWLLTVGALAAGIGAAAPASAQTAASAFTWATRYDDDQRITGTIAPDPDGSGPLHYAAVRNTYDLSGRLIKIESGELATWQPQSVAPAGWSGFTVFKQADTTYDLMDRKLTERVSSGSVNYTLTQYKYDALGRLECTAVRMNPAVYGSLPTSACTLWTEGNYGPDRITKATYNLAGELVQEFRAWGTNLEQAHATYGYTLNGKRNVVIDAGGNKATMSYDGFDRQLAWFFPSPTTPGTVSASDYEAYGYDANGNRTHIRKRDGRNIFYGYDALNRLLLKTIPDCPVPATTACPLTPAQTRDVYYDYDLRGLQTQARFDSPLGEGVTNVWDGFGRLASASTNIDGTARILSYQYDENGNRVRITHPDSNYFTSGYDGLDRLSLVREGGSAWLNGYSYNAQGLRSGESYAGASVGSSGYAYDGVGRLTILARDLVGTANDVSWVSEYNPASQATYRYTNNDSYVWNGYVAVNRTYTANGLNQYSAAGSATFSYDATGNLTGDGSTTYTYDVENRLITASNGANLKYDPLGRLWEVTKGSATTRFVYDGDQLTLEYDGSGNLLRRFVPGPGIDEQVAWYQGAGIGTSSQRFNVLDRQGSVVSVLNASGALVVVNAYDEYGIPKSGNGGRMQYTGQAWLDELGMYYYKARMYSPTLGRFMQTDPIGYDDQINLYTYVANDPVNMRDPTGMDGACIYSSSQCSPQGPTIGSVVAEKVSSAATALKGIFVSVVSGADQATNAPSDFRRNYSEMREANTIGGDKYFHCKANCEAASRGPVGERVAEKISNVREITDQRIKGDPRSASVADQAANRQGRTAGAEAALRGMSPIPGAQDRTSPNICRAACEPLRPRGLPEKY